MLPPQQQTMEGGVPPSPSASPSPSPSASSAAPQETKEVDPAFEFAAPKYIDFTTHVEDKADDIWFGMFNQY